VDVVFGPDHCHAAFVVVRLSMSRRSVVPVEAVEAVVPATQLVVLQAPRRRRIPPVLHMPRVQWFGRVVEAVAAAAPPVAAACARLSLRFGRAALLASTARWSALRRLARWSAPRAVRAGRTIARAGALAASLTALALGHLTRTTHVLAPRAARRLAGALAAAAALVAVLLDELAAAWVKRRPHHR